MKKTKVSTYRYHNYRKYLADWMQANSVSLRQLSILIDLSPSYLSQILNNKKDLGLDSQTLGRIKKVFRLDKNELKHFKDLVELSKSESHPKKIEIYNKIIKDTKYTSINTSEAETYSYLNHWFYVALREYFSLEKKGLDLKKVKADFIFGLKYSEIKKAVGFLIKSGFVEVEQDTNHIVAKPSHVKCYSDIYRLSLSAFHSQMFKLAIESIEKVDRDERLILGNTVCLSDESFEKVKHMIENLHVEIQKIEDTDTKKSKVYHIGQAAFPLTKRIVK